MTDNELLGQMLKVIDAYSALGNRTAEKDGALFISNPAVSFIRDANHVSHICASSQDEIERLLANAEEVYAGIPHRRFDLDPFTPPQVEAALSFSGYKLSTALLMVLEGEPGGRPANVPISLVTTMEDRSALRELIIMFKAPHFGEVLAQSASDHVIAKPAIMWWIAKWDGQPAGFLSGWTHSGLCFLEDLFVHPDFRNRGIATALIHRVTRELRAQGGDIAFLQADPNDTPKEMYKRMGFRPFALLQEYWREV